jgi:tryptophanyl-tRNA synthetase
MYRLVASAADTAAMRSNYEKGGYGYGHSKKALYELLLEKFRKEREVYAGLMANPNLLEDALAMGEKRAAQMADAKLREVRKVLGY